jgi:phosphomannomutase
LTRTFRAEAGIVISASHNPFDDNGIKFFSSEGTSSIASSTSSGNLVPSDEKNLIPLSSNGLCDAEIIIGKDTRISGYMLESALEAGLAAAGLTAAFTGSLLQRRPAIWCLRMRRI